MDPSDIKVMLGSHNLMSESELKRVTPTVSAIHIHPEFEINSVKSDFDIAVIVLAAPVSQSKLVNAINLINEDIDQESLSYGIIASFGYIHNGKLAVKSAPKKLEVVIEVENTCLFKNQAVIEASGNRTFCINENSSDRVCIEDIGSALFVEHERKFYLRGILSTVVASDIDVCDDQTYSIFTDVPKFNEWIQEVPETPIQSISGFTVNSR